MNNKNVKKIETKISILEQLIKTCDNIVELSKAKDVTKVCIKVRKKLVNKKSKLSNKLDEHING